MLDYILPNEIAHALDGYDEKRLYEIRLRCDRDVRINNGGVNQKLLRNGLPIKCGIDDCNGIMAKAAEYSIYSVNNQIVEGFVTVGRGVRIGLCGEIVKEKDGIKTVKNFSSLNIRLPHDVVGCSDEVFSIIKSGDRVLNSLIVAPPGKGKTTMLRDLGRKLSRGNNNVLIVDERNELYAFRDGKPQFEVGENCDVITFGSKDFAFSYGVRTMSPDVIITDELMNENDAEAVALAAAGGVNVIASVHAESVEELKNKKYLNNLLACGMIERFVFLSGRTLGAIKYVYGRSAERLI